MNDDEAAERSADEQNRDQDGIDTACYEFGMMLRCAALVSAESIPGARRNAFLESFLLHARSLRGFFSGKPEHPDGDDVRASHLVTDFTRRISTIEGDRGKVLDKMLAHATYGRQAHDQIWPVREIVEELSTAWRGFATALEQSKNVDIRCVQALAKESREPRTIVLDAGTTSSDIAVLFTKL